jgi:hypothetical protein
MTTEPQALLSRLREQIEAGRGEYTGAFKRADLAAAVDLLSRLLQPVEMTLERIKEVLQAAHQGTIYGGRLVEEDVPPIIMDLVASALASERAKIQSELQAAVTAADVAGYERGAARRNSGQCEGCGFLTGNRDDYKAIHVTNGVLTLCMQCLGDVNRKNPELVELREQLANATTMLQNRSERA